MNPILADIYSTILPSAPYIIAAYALLWVALLAYVLIIFRGTKKAEAQLMLLDEGRVAACPPWPVRAMAAHEDQRVLSPRARCWPKVGQCAMIATGSGSLKPSSRFQAGAMSIAPASVFAPAAR